MSTVVFLLFLLSAGLVSTIVFLFFSFLPFPLVFEVEFFFFFPFFGGWMGLCFFSLLPSPEQAVRNRSLCFLVAALIHVDPVRNHAMNDMLCPSAPNIFHVT